MSLFQAISVHYAGRVNHRIANVLDWMFVPIAFIISRAILIPIAIIAVMHPQLFPAPIGARQPASLADMWFHWDAQYYIRIAQHGYIPETVSHWPAFFPLFPLLEYLVSFLFNGNTYIAGVVIANIAMLIALILLYRLVVRDFSKGAARLSVLLLLAFPPAFFTVVPYPESLLLALSIGSFLAARQRQWALAGGLGLLAAFTRQSGSLLIIPFLWEYLSAHEVILAGVAPKWATRFSGRVREIASRLPSVQVKWSSLRQALRPSLLFALGFPLGIVIYAAWLWYTIDDPLAFLHAQATWGRTFLWPWETLARGWGDLSSETDPFLIARSLFEFFAIIVMLAVCALGWVRGRIPASYMLLGTAMLLFFLSSTLTIRGGWGLTSQGRFMLEVFPLFVVGAFLLERARWVTTTYLVIGLIIQCVLMAWFSLGYWVI